MFVRSIGIIAVTSEAPNSPLQYQDTLVAVEPKRSNFSRFFSSDYAKNDTKNAADKYLAKMNGRDFETRSEYLDKKDDEGNSHQVGHGNYIYFRKMPSMDLNGTATEIVVIVICKQPIPKASDDAKDEVDQYYNFFANITRIVTAANTTNNAANDSKEENSDSDNKKRGLFVELQTMVDNPPEYTAKPNVQFSDKIMQIQANLHDIKAVMQNNIDKMLVRGDKISELLKKTDTLQDNAAKFNKKAKAINSCCRLGF